jgi:uncharacterized membrane protein
VNGERPAGPPIPAGSTVPPASLPGLPPVARVELRIARILVLGTRTAVAVLAIGVGLFFATGRSPLETGWPILDIARLPADLVALRPEAFLWIGLLLVLATPLLRVMASTLGFVATGERRMAALGAAVLVVLALAVVTAGATGG